MSIIIVIIHIFVSLGLIMVVLLQSGKGADMGLAFGGGASQTLFGATGALTFLHKATTVMAVVFMLTTFSLAYMWGHRTGDSLMKDIKPTQSAQTPSEDAPSQEDQAESKTEEENANMVVTDNKVMNTEHSETVQTNSNIPVVEVPNTPDNNTNNEPVNAVEETPIKE